MEDRDRIHEVIEGAALLLINAGLGGGTGDGAAPVAGQLE
jgi:cell division GTPase FtsZ